ncbi:MAP7 domain-containing protein 3 isoform X2 [Manis pentadactyla]|uniref:MAP7 domain-containing protein 3 isoform X2 n=1 Tax=Manis pentadactyla TaxID=143292 RepID=UPI00255CB69E|nr:MAP7 domain-containing protein 3 isoform X2 [Manis pentadactyla]
MADRPGAGGSTSLRGLREQMVAAAHAIAEERRNQSSSRSLPPQSSNIRSAFKPVIDGSMLKSDVKQRLAKERREERKRQQDANKEIQLLEKERKSKIQFEKQMEEKQRKLKEQKEKDEQRRISAEEKRKQKLREERERFTAVLYRSLERSNRVDHRQKRWSWEGSTTVNLESKTANKRSISTEKLEQETSGRHKHMSVSSTGLQNSIANKKTERRSSSLNRRCSKLHSSTETEQIEEKPAARYPHTSLRENNLITRLLVPTKASIARSKSAASLSVPGKDTSGINTLIQCTNMPLCSHSGDELKKTTVLRKSVVLPQEKIETPPKVSLEAPPKENVEVPPRENVEAPSEESVEAPPKENMEAPPEENMEVPPEAIMEAPPKASVEAPPEENVEALPETSVEECPKVSTDTPPKTNVAVLTKSMETSPEVSTDPSPEVSMDMSREVSVDSSLEISTEMSSEASMEASPEASVEVYPKASMEALPKERLEVSPKTSTSEASPEVSVDTSSKVKMRDSPQKSEMDKQASNPVSKKRPSSHIPCYKWPSPPASGWRPPSPISANKQTQKNRPPSPSPVMSKQSAQSSLSYKIIPVQRTVFAQNALGSIGKKREAVPKTTNSSVAGSQKHMISEGSGNKSTPGSMNAEEATKILAEKRRLAREQREKEERLRKETEQGEVKDMAKKAVEGQEEEFLKSEDGQGQKEVKPKKECQDQEDQKVLLQKEDTSLKAQEEADKRKKEHERIMLQNLKERLERKKRIEEIMKRTRKTDSIASKAVETSVNNTYEEDEADDEDESESDEESFESKHPSALNNGVDSSIKLKTHFKNVKNTPNLMFLDATSGQDHKETKTFFNGDMKTFRQRSVKDPLTQAKCTRPSTKRSASQAAKTREADEASNSVGPSRSLSSEAEEWLCDRIIGIASETESLMSSVLPDSPEHHLEESITFHPSPQIPLDDKEEDKCVPAASDI